MISKDYCFGTYKDNQFEIINTHQAKMVTAQHFFGDAKGICKSEKFSKETRREFAEKIAQRYNEKYQIIIRKKNKFYSYSEGKVQELDINLIQKIIKEENKKDFQQTRSEKLLEISKCQYCQTNLSGNYTTVESSSQFNFEFAWAPYYKISNRQGFSIPLAISSYSLEDDNLKESSSLIYKLQILWRVYFDRLFFEAGLGQHHIAKYQDTSMIQTFGAGYVYKNRQWFLIQELGLGGYYVRASKVNWRLDLMEYQLGFMINF